MKFRLLLGEHSICHRTYKTGDVIETVDNLIKRFNKDGYKKFEEVNEDVPASKAVGRYRFRVANGSHCEAPNWVADSQGNLIPDPFHPVKMYNKGDIIETDLHLGYVFDKTSVEGFRKFELLGTADDTREELLRQRAALDARIAEMQGSSPAPTNVQEANDDAALNAMTFDELKKFAAGEEIDATGCKTQKELIAKIKAEMKKLTATK